MSLDDKIDSTKDKVSGKAKEVEGKVTNDKAREAEGKGQGILGKAKDKLSDAKDAIKDTVDNVKEKLDKDLVVLPMLFMTKPGFAQKIREYVENGGTVVATYLLGYVDESTLCWLGGFPGDGLREVCGVTASELDTLYPGEGNRAIWVKSSQQSSIKDYCELLQPAEGTEVVAVYGQDFYSGHAAVTHHVFGKGDNDAKQVIKYSLPSFL